MSGYERIMAASLTLPASNKLGIFPLLLLVPLFLLLQIAGMSAVGVAGVAAVDIHAAAGW
jgi:hypothetical protein